MCKHLVFRMHKIGDMGTRQQCSRHSLKGAMKGFVTAIYHAKKLLPTTMQTLTDCEGVNIN